MPSPWASRMEREHRDPEPPPRGQRPVAMIAGITEPTVLSPKYEAPEAATCKHGRAWNGQCRDCAVEQFAADELYDIEATQHEREVFGV